MGGFMRFARFFAVAAGAAGLLIGATGCEVFDPANADARNADTRSADARRVDARDAGAAEAQAPDPYSTSTEFPTVEPTAPPPTRPSAAWVEVIPRTVTAGSPVTVEADCGPGAVSAVAKSDAFAAVTLTPAGDVLSAEARVARRTLEGTYKVFLACANEASATTDIVVVAPGTGQATIGPHTGGGFLAHDSSSGSAGRAEWRSSEPAGWVVSGPAGWLAGGAAAFAAAAAAGGFSLRRRPRPRRRTR